MTWSPTRANPIFILAMDHRASFGASLFGVKDDRPTAEQAHRMREAKDLTYSALHSIHDQTGAGRAAVLVDERYGQQVIDEARKDSVVLATPIEASGHDWFTLEWGDGWLDHVRTVAPDYAKVLVRDNPEFDAATRRRQFDALAEVSAALRDAGVAFLYELLVPATPSQLDSAGNDGDRYDRDIRPWLTVQVLADNQRAGVAPALWKLEGLETADAATSVVAQARSGADPADVILLGRDAPTERLDHWIDVAAPRDGFVGFAIGRSIWEDAIHDHLAGTIDRDAARAQIAQRYLHFVRRWTDAAQSGPPS
jgi:myo-inositol catabolism protein IolC